MSEFPAGQQFCSHTPSDATCRRTRFRAVAAPRAQGQVTCRDHTVRISAEAVDEQFIQNLGALIRRISSDEPARRVPSRQECRFCDISVADCPERVEDTYESEAGETADF